MTENEEPKITTKFVFQTMKNLLESINDDCLHIQYNLKMLVQVCDKFITLEKKDDKYDRKETL